MFKSQSGFKAPPSFPAPGYRSVVILILLLALLGVGAALFWSHIVGHKPVISLVDRVGSPLDVAVPVGVGKKILLHVVVNNDKSGVCQVSGRVVQNDLSINFIDFDADDDSGQSVVKSPQGVILQLDSTDIDLLARGLKDGPVQLLLTAKNCSWLSREVKISWPAVVDMLPPQVSVTSSQHYVNQGGADLLTYHVSPDTVASEVRVGPYRFKGHLKPGAAPESGERFAFFVYSYDLPPDTPIVAVAIDQAGNEATSTMTPAKFFPKVFRHRELPIDDNFITTKVADIISHTPELKNQGDNLKNYLMVNRDLRKKNNQFLVDLSKKSEEKFYWKDAFKPMMNAAVEASFADYRSYMYNGQKVDEQVHLGFDMASTQNVPIVSAGRGRVIFADYLGIYGNTVVVDHGYGLFTLYGHMSAIDVAVGQMVDRDQKIGNSGATGLAGGDHLHFSMLIDGVQTNPVEFWDPHWIKDHVYLRVGETAFGGS